MLSNYQEMSDVLLIYAMLFASKVSTFCTQVMKTQLLTENLKIQVSFLKISNQ
jgi:hypothetical protein